MIDSVAGVEISPRPVPMTSIWPTIVVAYDASAGIVEIQRNAPPRSVIPTVTTAFTPTRGASRPPTIEATAMLSATGRIRTPVPSAE